MNDEKLNDFASEERDAKGLSDVLRPAVISAGFSVRIDDRFLVVDCLTHTTAFIILPSMPVETVRATLRHEFCMCLGRTPLPRKFRQ